MAKARDYASQYPDAATDEWRAERDAPRKLFDITAVIGSVYDGGNQHPRAAAFLTIEEYTRGVVSTMPNMVFEFPNEDGSVNRLTLEVEPARTS